MKNLGIVERFELVVRTDSRMLQPEYVKGFRNKVVQLWETKEISYEEMNILTQLLDNHLIELTGRL